MIINFSIKNFTSIKEEITLSFEATKSNDLEDYYIITPKKGLRLLKLGLIYGPNGSGKTNILKALNFLKNMVVEPLEKKTEAFEFQPFLFDVNTPKEHSFFSLEFIQNKVKYLYQLEFNKNAIINEKLHFYNPNKALVYERSTNLDKRLSRIEFGGKIKINKEHKAVLEANTLWNNTVLGGFLKTNIGVYELEEVTAWFTNKLKYLIHPKTDLLHYISIKIEKGEIEKENIVAFLKLADFKIVDIEISNLDANRLHEKQIEKELYKMLLNSTERINEIKRTQVYAPKEAFFKHSFNNLNNTNVCTLPYEEESQGTQRYFQLSGLLDLMIRTESIFSIDELESSLHPDLLKHFILTFLVNSKNSQLIATTHLRELLMEKDIFRNDAIWLTEKKEDGGTDLFSVADFDSSVIRNTSSVYNAYKIGKLGAVPELGDYYIDLEHGKEKK